MQSSIRKLSNILDGDGFLGTGSSFVVSRASFAVGDSFASE